MKIKTSLLAGLLFLQCLPLPAKEKPALLVLSLRDAIRIALAPQGNMSLGVAGESLRAAEARFRQSQAAKLPEIETSVGGQNQILNLAALGFESVRLPVSGFAFPRSVGPFNTVDARVHVRQSLIDPASTRRSQAMRSAIETARDESGEVRDEVAAQVAKLYLAAVHAADEIETAKATVVWAEASLQEVSNRNATGKALGIEVSRARARLATEKRRLAELALARSRVTIELLSVLNRDLDTPVELTDPLEFNPTDLMQPENALALARKSRAGIVVERQRLETARLNDESIHSERLPSLAGYANVGSLGTTVVNSTGTYNVGVSLRIPVFDGGRRNSRREETQALMRQEQLRVSQTEKRVELEVRQALLKLEIARAQVDTATEEVDLAEQETAHRQRRYTEGIDDRLILAEAQVKLAGARGGRAAALYGWNEARVELMQAMGTIGSLAQ